MTLTINERADAEAAMTAWFASPSGCTYSVHGGAWTDDELTAMHAALTAPTVDDALAAVGAAPGDLDVSSPDQDAENASLMAAIRDLARRWRPVPTGGRTWTPDTWAPGKTSGTIHVKRCCNGCGRELGDVTDEEIVAAIDGRPLPDVTGECGCRAGGPS